MTVKSTYQVNKLAYFLPNVNVFLDNMNKFVQSVVKARSLICRPNFAFSDKPPIDPNDQPSKSELVDQSKQDLPKPKLNRFWEGYREHMIAIVKDSEKPKPKSSEEYRIAILFEEILSKEKDLLLYDTGSLVFRWKWFMTIMLIFGASTLTYGVYQSKLFKKRRLEKLKVAVGILFIATRLRAYRSFQKPHVERIIYSTGTKKLTLVKRSFLGLRKKQEVTKDKLLFTSDKYLNAININYINIDTMEGYQIGYVYAWKNKELFTHLLQQNIQSI